MVFQPEPSEKASRVTLRQLELRRFGSRLHQRSMNPSALVENCGGKTVQHIMSYTSNNIISFITNKQINPSFLPCQVCLWNLGNPHTLHIGACARVGLVGGWEWVRRRHLFQHGILSVLLGAGRVSKKVKKKCVFVYVCV